ncbi:hypothetical protein ACEPAF_1424 [Sanghuangporus sanghuang]
MAQLSKPGQKRTRKPYGRLGNSGLKVSKIILSCMSYGAGIQIFDTANIYSNGLSEIILGKATKKFNFPRDEMGLGRKHIFDAVERSLKRLQLDYIDILQCHRFDPFTPIEETIQALHDIVESGRVRYIGMSSYYAWQCYAKSVFTALLGTEEDLVANSKIDYGSSHNLTPFVSMQNHYNLAYKEDEREMMPLLKYLGVGSILWSLLARGFLTQPLGGQSRRGETDD